MSRLLASGILAMTSAAALAGEPTAEQMMIRAHEARAEWHDFPGFTADVTLLVDGRSASGTITVFKDGEVKLDVPNAPEQSWFDHRLESFVSHQIARGGEQAYDVSFADDVADHPLGRLIKFDEDRLHSHYRINGDVITEVHRTMGEVRFTITVLDVGRTPDDRYHSNLYNVAYWNAKTGDLVKTEVYRNAWRQVGGFAMPKRLTTVISTGEGKQSVREVRFENLKLTE